MATKTWIGGAPAEKQVTTFTPANVEIGDVFRIVIGQRTVSFTATLALVANVTAGLQAACAASEYPEFSSDIVWTEDGTKVTATANVAGEPFVATTSTTNGGAANTQTLTASTTTASKGPKHLDDANNWSSSTLPTTGDAIVFERWSGDIKYGLEGLSAETFASVAFRQTFTGTIGLPFNRNTSRREYLPRYFKAGMTVVTVGDADGLGAGSGLIRLDTGTAQTTLTMNLTGAPVEAGAAALEWKGTHASNLIHLIKGVFGTCRLSGETSTIATLRVDFVTDSINDSLSIIESGCALGTVEANSGLIGLKVTPTTIKYRNGKIYVFAGCDLTAVTTIDLADGGPMILSKAG